MVGCLRQPGRSAFSCAAELCLAWAPDESVSSYFCFLRCQKSTAQMTCFLLWPGQTLHSIVAAAGSCPAARKSPLEQTQRHTPRDTLISEEGRPGKQPRAGSATFAQLQSLLVAASLGILPH